ncbi:hypothetical protein NDU88_001422, partial [Pleurodeles waltl]
LPREGSFAANRVGAPTEHSSVWPAQPSVVLQVGTPSTRAAHCLAIQQCGAAISLQTLRRRLDTRHACSAFYQQGVASMRARGRPARSPVGSTNPTVLTGGSLLSTHDDAARSEPGQRHRFCPTGGSLLCSAVSRRCVRGCVEGCADPQNRPMNPLPPAGDPPSSDRLRAPPPSWGEHRALPLGAGTPESWIIAE